MAAPTCPFDPNSFANSHELKIKHIAVKLNVDFDSKTLIGSAVYVAEAIKDSEKIVLDVNHPVIEKVQLEDGQELTYAIGPEHPAYGRPLTITLPSQKKGNEVKFAIDFRTTEKCLAGQWLEPVQTVGKKFPYFFTQCQPIHARTLMPLQDTPSVKFTYTAEISVPAHLRALMSAVPVKEEIVGDLKICHFNQAIAIPSYLLALAVGNLEGRRVGPRSTVWSEPEVVEEAAWEFVDTEKFISTDIDPDDALSSIPYEKGFHFLFYLETILGGASVFDKYLKYHVEKFSHKSITSEDFKANLYTFFSDKKEILDGVNWDEWFNGVGMPPVKNEFDTTLADACHRLAERWDKGRDAPSTAGFTAADIADFDSNQIVVFLESLLNKAALPIAALDFMDELYKLTTRRNSDIKLRWLQLNLGSNHEALYTVAVEFVTSIGRMKYVRPVYRALAKAKNGLALAQETFKKNKSFYHPICAALVEKDLFSRSQ
ncbi:Leukotriene A-4 hydrolase [Phlyctochytrium bullatum]|nr:Leukotriene A-4 hydrolase [Phlyctochytrium bullatum]